MRVTYDNSSRAVRAAGVAILAAGLLSGCFGGSADSDAEPQAVTTGPPQIQPGRPGEPNQTGFFTPPEDQWNEADAELATEMIPHHRQALDMSSLAAERAQNAKVKAIAERIHAEQEPEIEMLEAWLSERGYAVPPTPGADAHGHDDSGHEGMPGMATPEQMDALAAASGEEFDRMFLEMMIRHHQGALTMVEDWAGRGSEIRMQEIGSEIHVTQVGEIRRMEDILAELDG